MTTLVFNAQQTFRANPITTRALNHLVNTQTLIPHSSVRSFIRLHIQIPPLGPLELVESLLASNFSWTLSLCHANSNLEIPKDGLCLKLPQSGRGHSIGARRPSLPSFWVSLTLASVKISIFKSPESSNHTTHKLAILEPRADTKSATYLLILLPWPLVPWPLLLQWRSSLFYSSPPFNGHILDLVITSY